MEVPSDHAHVLLCVAREPQSRLREITEAIDITERAAHRIIAELKEGSYVSRDATGGATSSFHPDAVIRHRTSSTRCSVAALGELVAPLIDPQTVSTGTPPA